MSLASWAKGRGKESGYDVLGERKAGSHAVVRPLFCDHSDLPEYSDGLFLHHPGQDARHWPKKKYIHSDLHSKLVVRAQRWAWPPAL